MSITLIKEILNGDVPLEKTVTIFCWIRTRRDSKKGFSFLSVHDGSCFDSFQIVLFNNLKNYYSDVLHLTSGCSVKISGIIKKSKGDKQNFELLAKKINIIGKIDNPETYPITPKHHTEEYLREVAHLRPRTNLIGSITRIRSTIAQSIHNFFRKENYFWVPTPIITTSNTEGGGKMFRISTLDFNNIPKTKNNNIDFNKDFFGRETFLTVSGQLNAEAYACALGKVYTFGPTFRAENSNTNRHLAEFWMVEPEVAFADLNDIISLSEKMLKYIFKDVLKKQKQELLFLSKRNNKNIIGNLEKFICSKINQIDYTDSIKILKKYNKKFSNQVNWGIDLSLEHERYLVENYFKTPIVIKNYPKNIKAFYMRLNKDNKTVAAMDVLMPGIGEIIGGSQREERLHKLINRMKSMNLLEKNYQWYLDLRRYGTVPHSGFGLGFERLISYITGIKNVRDAIPFPRTARNAHF